MVQAQDIHEANSSLQHLNISNNEISDEGATALAQAFEGETCRVLQLFL